MSTTDFDTIRQGLHDLNHLRPHRNAMDELAALDRLQSQQPKRLTDEAINTDMTKK